MVRVAGLMAISDFEYAPAMAKDLAHRVELIVLRFDALNGSKKVFKQAAAECSDVTRVHVIRSREKWNRWNWREQLIRALDPVKPEYVLAIDSDEKFDDGFDADFQNFVESGDEMMMFDYNMATCDDRRVMKYPGARHCKAFKWAPQVGYRPYRGYARPTFVGRKTASVYNAETPIHHFCFYTPEMERWKRENLHR